VTETLFMFSQLVLPVVGIHWTLWLDRRARPFWLLYCGLTLLYAVADTAAGAGLVQDLRLATGDAVEKAMSDSMQASALLNVKVAIFSAIWMFYWYFSKRVRVNFGPPSNSTVAPVTTAPEPSTGIPPLETNLEATIQAADAQASDELTSKATVPPVAISPGATSTDSQKLEGGRDERRCPYCAEWILVQAVYCKHCHQQITTLPDETMK
jgi:hypothetical protein